MCPKQGSSSAGQRRYKTDLLIYTHQNHTDPQPQTRVLQAPRCVRGSWSAGACQLSWTLAPPCLEQTAPGVPASPPASAGTQSRATLTVWGSARWRRPGAAPWRQGWARGAPARRSPPGAAPRLPFIRARPASTAPQPLCGARTRCAPPARSWRSGPCRPPCSSASWALQLWPVSGFQHLGQLPELGPDTRAGSARFRSPAGLFNQNWEHVLVIASVSCELGKREPPSLFLLSPQGLGGPSEQSRILGSLQRCQALYRTRGSLVVWFYVWLLTALRLLRGGNACNWHLPNFLCYHKDAELELDPCAYNAFSSVRHICVCSSSCVCAYRVNIFMLCIYDLGRGNSRLSQSVFNLWMESSLDISFVL